MFHKYDLNYYYVSLDHAAKITKFQEVTGDSEVGLITQFVRGWIGRNRPYYTDLAKFDASCRGICLSEWGKIVVFEGMDKLPPLINYQAFPNALLLPELDFPADSVSRRGLKIIKLSMQNVAFLKLAVYYERVEKAILVSKIIKEHLDRNWDTLYEPQVQAEDFTSWDGW